jgi:hypothetical protein
MEMLILAFAAACFAAGYGTRALLSYRRRRRVRLYGYP